MLKIKRLLDYCVFDDREQLWFSSPLYVIICFIFFSLVAIRAETCFLKHTENFPQSRTFSK